MPSGANDLRRAGFGEVFIFAHNLDASASTVQEILGSPHAWRMCAFCKNRYADLSRLPRAFPRDTALTSGFCSRECAGNHLGVTDDKLDAALAERIMAADPNFYKTREWLELRYWALQVSNGKCRVCGVSGAKKKLHVDHIKPRWYFPELALDPGNVQVLCEDCNRGKGRWDDTDWGCV